jgi:hypothetical protein
MVPPSVPRMNRRGVSREGGQIQTVITKLLAAYQDVIPIPYTYAWDTKQRLLRVQSELVSWTAIFTPQRAVVIADISFIGRFLWQTMSVTTVHNILNVG